MTRNSLITSLIFCLLCFAACSRRDKVINVEEDDPEMVAAIAKARDTLPHFWQVYEKPARGETNFALKLKITDKRGSEARKTRENGWGPAKKLLD